MEKVKYNGNPSPLNDKPYWFFDQILQEKKPASFYPAFLDLQNLNTPEEIFTAYSSLPFLFLHTTWTESYLIVHGLRLWRAVLI